MIPGVHPLGGLADGWMGVGLGMGVWGVSHVCMHAHARMHTHTHMHVKHAKHGCLHVCGHLQFLYMYKCACVHVRACMCMCVGGTPPCPQMPPPPTCPLPRAAGPLARVTFDFYSFTSSADTGSFWLSDHS